MKNKSVFLRVLRIIIYFALILSSVIVIVTDMGMNDSMTIIFTIFLIAGIIGLFIETYK